MDPGIPATDNVLSATRKAKVNCDCGWQAGLLSGRSLFLVLTVEA